MNKSNQFENSVKLLADFLVDTKLEADRKLSGSKNLAACSDQVSRWFYELNSTDSIKSIANDARYKINSFFGSKKKRLRLCAEVSCINAAITIQLINECFNDDELKPVIDGFLAIISRTIFDTLEMQTKTFKHLYPMRMESYFRILNEQGKEDRLADAFLINLNPDNQPNTQARNALSHRFSKILKHGRVKMCLIASQESNAMIEKSFMGLIDQMKETAARGEK